MRDAFSTEIKIGDTVVYCQRQSSSQWLTKGIVEDFGTRRKYSWRTQQEEFFPTLKVRAIAGKWFKEAKKLSTLGVSDYIVVVS